MFYLCSWCIRYTVNIEPFQMISLNMPLQILLTLTVKAALVSKYIWFTRFFWGNTLHTLHIAELINQCVWVEISCTMEDRNPMHYFAKSLFYASRCSSQWKVSWYLYVVYAAQKGPVWARGWRRFWKSTTSALPICGKASWAADKHAG